MVRYQGSYRDPEEERHCRSSEKKLNASGICLSILAEF